MNPKRRTAQIDTLAQGIMKQPGLRKALIALVGRPRAAIRRQRCWVSRSQRHSAAALASRAGHRQLVGYLLKDLGFSLQADAKTRVR